MRAPSLIVGHAEVPPEQLLPHPQNWRRHGPRQAEALLGAIADVGFLRSVTVNRTTGHILDGHLRVAQAPATGQAGIPVEYVELTPEEEAEALLSIDPIAGMAEHDAAALEGLLAACSPSSAALRELLADLAAMAPPDLPGGDDGAATAAAGASLAERFIVPPFSVLDARAGYWQERKRAWIALGIKGELGRGDAAADGLLGFSEQARTKYRGRGRTFGQDLMRGEHRGGRHAGDDSARGREWGGAGPNGHQHLRPGAV